MECADAELVLSRFLDGDFDGSRVQESRSHLTVCRDCRELIANLLLVQAMGRVVRGTWGKTKTCQVSET
jgi:hypothetical protein